MRSTRGVGDQPWTGLVAELNQLTSCDLAGWSDEQVHDALTAVLAGMNQLTALASALTASFEVRNLAVGDGQRSTRDWLGWIGRMSPAAAKALQTRGELMRALPALGKAALAGVVNPEHLRKVDDLCRHVGTAPVVEFDTALAALASQVGPVEMAAACERIRHWIDPDGPEPDPDATERRGITLSRSGSLFSLRGLLDLDGGAALLTALDAVMAPPTAGDERSAAQRRHDALIDIARQALTEGRVPTVGGVRPHLGLLITPDTLLSPHPHHSQHPDRDQPTTSNGNTFSPDDSNGDGPGAGNGAGNGAAAGFDRAQPTTGTSAHGWQPPPGAAQAARNTAQAARTNADATTTTSLHPTPDNTTAREPQPQTRTGPNHHPDPDDEDEAADHCHSPHATHHGATNHDRQHHDGDANHDFGPDRQRSAHTNGSDRHRGTGSDGGDGEHGNDSSGVEHGGAPVVGGDVLTRAGIPPGPEPPWLNWAGHIPTAIAQRIACDCQIWRAILDPTTGLPLEVGRTHRIVPTWIRKALHARDRGCRWPGCHTNAAWTDAHHLIDWYYGGDTNIDNLLLLCRWHHSRVHEGQWRIRLDPTTGEVWITRPNGQPYEHGPSQPWRPPPPETGQPEGGRPRRGKRVHGEGPPDIGVQEAA